LGNIEEKNIFLFQEKIVSGRKIYPIAAGFLLSSMATIVESPLMAFSRRSSYMCSIYTVTFIFEKEKKRSLVWIIPQRFCYRWIMYVVLFKSLRKAVKGELQHWGVLKRSGNVQYEAERV